MYIEETINDANLPVNSRAMIFRLEELMAEHGTNCLSDCKDDHRVRACLWLMISQVYGQVGTVDMHDEHRQLQTAFAVVPNKTR